jgi:hypothetical protein
VDRVFHHVVVGEEFPSLREALAAKSCFLVDMQGRSDHEERYQQARRRAGGEQLWDDFLVFWMQASHCVVPDD